MWWQNSVQNRLTARKGIYEPRDLTRWCSSCLWRPCVKHLIANSWREHWVHVLPRKPEHLTSESWTQPYHCCCEAAGTTCQVLSAKALSQCIGNMKWVSITSISNEHCVCIVYSGWLPTCSFAGKSYLWLYKVLKTDLQKWRRRLLIHDSESGSL